MLICLAQVLNFLPFFHKCQNCANADIYPAPPQNGTFRDLWLSSVRVKCHAGMCLCSCPKSNPFCSSVEREDNRNIELINPFDFVTLHYSIFHCITICYVIFHPASLRFQFISFMDCFLYGR